jgi:hypothetical protein
MVLHRRRWEQPGCSNTAVRCGTRERRACERRRRRSRRRRRRRRRRSDSSTCRGSTLETA